MQYARVVWQRDKQNRTPLMLPQRLARKYPECQFSWGWAWLFPAHYTCRDPITGTIVRYRMHEANVQRAVMHARRKLGISVLPHELRHGYATHCLERGTNPRAIQQAMGHKSLETTMGYLHAESLSVRSPLETLLVTSTTATDAPPRSPAGIVPGKSLSTLPLNHASAPCTPSPVPFNQSGLGCGTTKSTPNKPAPLIRPKSATNRSDVNMARVAGGRLFVFHAPTRDAGELCVPESVPQSQALGRLPAAGVQFPRDLAQCARYNSGQEFRHCLAQGLNAEGLVEKVVGANLQTAKSLAESSNQNDGLPRNHLFDSGDEFVTHHPRQVKVHDHEIELLPREQVEALDAVRSLNHRMPVGAQQPPDCFTNLCFVLNDEHALLRDFTRFHGKSCIDSKCPTNILSTLFF